MRDPEIHAAFHAAASQIGGRIVAQIILQTADGIVPRIHGPHDGIQGFHGGPGLIGQIIQQAGGRVRLPLSTFRQQGNGSQAGPDFIMHITGNAQAVAVQFKVGFRAVQVAAQTVGKPEPAPCPQAQHGAKQNSRREGA